MKILMGKQGPKGFLIMSFRGQPTIFPSKGSFSLGEGGFGGVYKGLLTGPVSREIAVKKIKSGSNQGKKEYISEVKIISSLDSHLFGRKLVLIPWATRHKIALGLASEWEQSVVHRDIKCSDVMLDLNFNPKLGDFGLARLADHDVGLQTTVPAGTPG